jgi:hypothetical protein
MIKEKIKTTKGVVKNLRAIRDQFNADIQDMTLEEEKKYLETMLAKWKGFPQHLLK